MLSIRDQHRELFIFTLIRCFCNIVICQFDFNIDRSPVLCWFCWVILIIIRSIEYHRIVDLEYIIWFNEVLKYPFSDRFDRRNTHLIFILFSHNYAVCFDFKHRFTFPSMRSVYGHNIFINSFLKIFLLIKYIALLSFVADIGPTPLKYLYIFHVNSIISLLFVKLKIKCLLYALAH